MADRRGNVVSFIQSVFIPFGSGVVAGGTPGADLQVQTNAQILINILELGKNVQDAIDAPRWSYSASEGVQLESRFPQSIADELRLMGHKASLVEPWSGRFGRAQVVVRDPDLGTYAGGSDPRGEGCALGI